jgi:hypothetical protein
VALVHQAFAPATTVCSFSRMEANNPACYPNSMMRMVAKGEPSK